MNRIRSIFADIAKGLAEDFLWLIILAVIGGDAVITSLVLVIVGKATQNIELPLWQLGVMISLLILLLVVSITFIVNHSVKMIRKRYIYIRLKKYIENHNYVKSIQLYDLDKKVDNNLQLKFDINRVGGVTDKAFETNCILEDGCHIPLDFYVSCKDLFDIINADQKSLLEKTMNLALLETHVRMIADKCEEITKQYFSKVKIKELTYEHYIYYRVLFILAYKGYEFQKIVRKHRYGDATENWDDECDTVLNKKKYWLERTLQNGKRSQYYAALLLDETFCFEHEVNALKQDRCYFSSKFKIPNKNNEYLMIVTYDVVKIAAVTKKEKVTECNRIRDDILNSLVRKKMG